MMMWVVGRRGIEQRCLNYSCISFFNFTVSAFRLLFLVQLLLTLATVHSLSYADEPVDDFLSEDISLDNILEDIPFTGNLKEMSREDISSLPFFSPEDASRLHEWLITHENTSNLSNIINEIEWLTTLQKAVIIELADRSDTGSDMALSFLSRQGATLDFNNKAQSSHAYYSRLDAAFGDFAKMSVLMDKDEGEPRAADFASVSLGLHSEKYGTDVHFGDFRPGYGQGLLFSRYTRYYGAATDVDAKFSDRVMSTSFEESRFFRGIHAKKTFRFLSAESIYSHRKLDATILDGVALNIREDGIHESGEIRNNLNEDVMMFRLRTNLPEALSAGITIARTEYNPTLGNNGSERTMNNPEGNVFRHFAFDGRYQVGGHTLFWEHALLKDSGNATIAGLELKKKSFRAALSYRDYDADYWSFRSAAQNGFGEVSNDRGVYAALVSDLAKNIRMDASYDIARKKNRSYLDPMPLTQCRLNMKLRYRIRRGLTISGQYRSTDREAEGYNRNSAGLRCTVIPACRFIRDGSMKVFRTSSGNTNGMYYELSAVTVYSVLRCDVSVGYSNISDYTARYYRYERDVPGKGMSRPVWGKGPVVSLLFRCKYLSLRYSVADTDLMRLRNECCVQFDHVW